MQPTNATVLATVLIVDDEPAVRELLSRWLRHGGYHCLPAVSARQARQLLDGQLLDGHSIDMAVLDLCLGGEDGLSLLRHVREAWPDVEAILLTGSGDQRTVIEALNRGAAGYLTKPCDRQELLFHVGRALERRRLRLSERLHTRHLERRVREQTATIRQAHEETIHRLLEAAMMRDEETGTHIRRLGLTSAVLAEAAGWSREAVDCIRLAAPMHDVGKIGIPDAILQKPGRLTEAEMAVMRQHTVIGARMLAGSMSDSLQMAERIALSHHERWDGTGYPHGLRREHIPEAARLVAIADVYDALTHDRVYRPALPEAEVLRIMRAGRGTHFDPQLLDLFLQLLPEIGWIASEHHDGPDDAPQPAAERTLANAVASTR
jgi:putative two-component system response regulator